MCPLHSLGGGPWWRLLAFCIGRNDDRYLANIGVHDIAVERNGCEHRVTADRQTVLEIELERGAFAKRGGTGEHHTLLIVDDHETAFRRRSFQHIRRYR